MAWIGLIVGALLGAAVAELSGAVVGGFLGWLAGVIIGSKKTPAAAATPPRETTDARVTRLEGELAALRERVRFLERGAVAAITAAEVPPPEPARPIVTEPVAEAVPEAVPELPPSPPPPREPAKPNPIVAWLLGGNTIARVGLLILFVGLAFLIKYAADNSLFPPEMRVASVGAAGIALLGFGWWLRGRRRAYALGLQGAGVATLYLTTFGALRLYSLIPPELAFGLLAAIAVFSAVLAVAQDAMVLAVIGAGGGFLAPILASTGGGSHVALFGYYLLLNLGIAGIAIFRAWRVLNLVGFLFTFFIGVAWGVNHYRPELFESTEPFLVAFFLLYVAVAVLYARRQPPDLKHYVDGTLVFGVPLGAFGLQAALMADMEFGLAFSALTAAALYIALAAGLKRSRDTERWGLMGEAFLALGVVFASLAIPFALDARWTSAGWALEGAAIVWIGVRQRRRLARAFGLLLQVGAAVAYVDAYGRFQGSTPLLDAAFLGALLIAAAGFVIYRVIATAGDRVGPREAGLAPVAFWWGLAWWLFAWLDEIDTFVHGTAQSDAVAALLAVTGATGAILATRFAWSAAATASRALLPLLAVLLVFAAVDKSHPLAGWGPIAWAMALVAQGVVLWLLEREPSGKKWGMALHAGTPWLVAALAGIELNWLAAKFTAHGTAWSVAAAALPAALLLASFGTSWVIARWPVAVHGRAYRLLSAAGLAAALLVWSLFANGTHDGRSDPLPYLPMLNALDLMHGIAFAAVVLAWRDGRRMTGGESWLSVEKFAAIAGTAAFIWLTSALLRTVHHWAGVPYEADDIARSFVAQAALSVFWAALALGLMVFATRSARRVVWIVGAALMAVVVAKLFLVDLSKVGGLERIVSFIVVGLLMLLIGYVSPVPPRAKAEASS